MGQGYKVTIDPALSPSSCAYRKVVNKWQVFTSNLNTFVLPTIDTRIASRSTGVVFSGTGSAGYASMAKDSNLVLDTNMFFVGCNSESTSTCQNNGTSSIADDKDPFNEDKASEKYLIRLKLKMGTAAQKIQVTGGQLKAFAVTIPAVKVYDSTGWAVVELPVSLVVSQRSQAILQIKTLGAGLKIQSVQIAESN